MICFEKSAVNRAEAKGCFSCVGVRSEDLRLVTQKFFRGQQAEQTGGAGLGLYLADSFMKEMHGRLECRNRPGGGFVVELYFIRADRV